MCTRYTVLVRGTSNKYFLYQNQERACMYVRAFAWLSSFGLRPSLRPHTITCAPAVRTTCLCVRVRVCVVCMRCGAGVYVCTRQVQTRSLHRVCCVRTKKSKEMRVVSILVLVSVKYIFTTNPIGQPQNINLQVSAFIVATSSDQR